MPQAGYLGIFWTGLRFGRFLSWSLRSKGFLTVRIGGSAFKEVPLSTWAKSSSAFFLISP